MTSEIERDFEADDGTPLTVYITVESYGDRGNGFDAPPESPVLYIERAEHRFTGEPVTLTQTEMERMEQAVCDEPDLGDEPDDYPGLWEE